MNISILGCGWLGLPLAQSLLKKAHSVKGSTTSPHKVPQLQKAGITPYQLAFTPELSAQQDVRSFWESEVLLLNIPPGRGRDNIVDYHRRQIHHIAECAAGGTIRRVIFISSTSVYPSRPGLVTEDDAVPGQAGRPSGNALLEAEAHLQSHPDFATTVIRFGGLYGGDRHPARYLAGRTGLKKAAAPVNLIHRDDCIAIIESVIEKEITGQVFNAVSDGHPGRELFYTRAAEAMGLEPPQFLPEEDPSPYKEVSNQKLKGQLGYRFIHPDPLQSLPL